MTPSASWMNGDARVRGVVDGWLEAGAPTTAQSPEACPLDDGRRVAVTVIADSAQRRLLRLVSGAGDDLLVKIFRAATSRHAVRERFKRRVHRSPANREWKSLHRLLETGVAVPSPLGRGRLPSGEDFIVEAFVPGESLHLLLERESKGRAGNREPGAESRLRPLLLALADLVRQLHDSGLAHGDLHPGNILVSPAGLVLLDLQRARPIRGTRSQRARDLALLDYSLSRHDVSLATRTRVQRRALGLHPQADATAVLRLLQRASRAAGQDHQRNLTRRSTRPHGENARLSTARGRGLRKADVPEGLLQSLLKSHHAAVEAADGRVLKADGRTRVTSHSLGERRVIVKEVRRVGAARQLADLFRRSPACRAWRASHGLRARGVGAPAPLAFVEQRRLFRPIRSWFVMDCVGEGDASGNGPLSGLPSCMLGNALYKVVICLHESGTVHGDLKANNIRLTRSRDTLTTALIDLENVRFRGRVSPSRRLKDLAQINASLSEAQLPASEREALLRSYVQRLPFPYPYEVVRDRIISLSLRRRHIWRGSDSAPADGR